MMQKHAKKEIRTRITDHEAKNACRNSWETNTGDKGEKL